MAGVMRLFVGQLMKRHNSDLLMVTRILGALVSLWGVFLLLSPDSNLPEDRDVFRDRLTLIIGVLLLSAGMYLLFRRSKRAKTLP
jgi:hypothetical protein